MGKKILRLDDLDLIESVLRIICNAAVWNGEKIFGVGGAAPTPQKYSPPRLFSRRATFYLEYIFPRLAEIVWVCCIFQARNAIVYLLLSGRNDNRECKSGGKKNSGQVVFHRLELGLQVWANLCDSPLNFSNPKTLERDADSRKCFASSDDSSLAGSLRLPRHARLAVAQADYQ